MIACIYEGNAEKAILDMLLEEDCLYFSEDDLLSGGLICRVSGRTFATRYLSYSLKDQKIDVIRVQDSRRASLGLPFAFQHLIAKEIKCLTRPEIEILVIIAEGRYEDFHSRKMKPSIYCKDRLGFSDVKSYGFMRDYFSDINHLLRAIKKYDEYTHQTAPDEITFYDLLNEDTKHRIDIL